MSNQIGKDVAHAAERLRAGRLVAMPTETVYGLAANALDPDAVARIFEAKGRPHFDPLIVHVADRGTLDTVADTPEGARRVVEQLTEAFWPGPLTLVLPRRDRIPDIVTSGLDTVAIRVPAHPLARALIEAAGVPVAAPSANPFGYVSPTTAAHVVDQLGDALDYVLDGGPARVGVESTIVAIDPDSGEVTQLRPGGTPREAIERIVGRPLALRQSTSDPNRPEAPGQLDSHYAPRVPLALGALETLVEKHGRDRSYCIGYRSIPRNARGRALAPDGDLRVAARELFATLREADASGAEIILAEPFPEEGLGAAIADRLRRAAGSRGG